MKKLLFTLLISLVTNIIAGQSAIDSSKYPTLVTFTAEQDHENMLQQLSIKKLRPGPSGDTTAPNHADYNEALANPYSNL